MREWRCGAEHEYANVPATTPAVRVFVARQRIGLFVIAAPTRHVCAPIVRRPTFAARHPVVDYRIIEILLMKGLSMTETHAAGAANRLIHETSPYLLQHAHNPVDWYPWGPEALRRAGRGQTHPPERRLFRVPLVLRDGARVIRGPGNRGPDERVVRQHQGGPRGTTRHRRHLHGGGAGDDRAWRLADDGVPDAERQALLWRHVLPAHSRQGMPASGRSCWRLPRPGATPPRAWSPRANGWPARSTERGPAGCRDAAQPAGARPCGAGAAALTEPVQRRVR